MNLRRFVLVGIFMFSMVTPALVFGQVTPCDPSGSGGGGLPPCSELGYILNAPEAGKSGGITTTSFVNTVINVINWFSWIVSAVAVVMGIYAGFLFMTARGEPATLSSARKRLIWAVVGIAVAILAFGIISITSTILGL